MENCFTYVFNKLVSEGGTFMSRQSSLASEYGITSKYHPLTWFPHFLHRSKDGKITQYTLSDEKKKSKTWKTKVVDLTVGTSLGFLFMILLGIISFLAYFVGLLYHYDGYVKGDDEF